jgi:hypothetical protein
MIQDGVYDHIKSEFYPMSACVFHDESQAPLCVYDNLLSKQECQSIRDASGTTEWTVKVEVSFDGLVYTQPNVQQKILSPLDPVLNPLGLKLNKIAPNWSLVQGGCKLIKYKVGGKELFHSDSNPTVFRPPGTFITNDNRYRYMKQASLLIYLNTVEEKYGAFTNFYDACNNQHNVKSAVGRGILHPCISAKQESSVDKVANNTLTRIHRNNIDGGYMLRDTAWFNESTPLKAVENCDDVEKYVLVCSLFDKLCSNLCDANIATQPFAYWCTDNSNYKQIFKDHGYGTDSEPEILA